jgi:hypothetical protein
VQVYRTRTDRNQQLLWQLSAACSRTNGQNEAGMRHLGCFASEILKAFKSSCMFNKKAFVIRWIATRYYFLLNIQLEFEMYFGAYVN